MAGYTGSFGAGGFDFWLVKADASGNMQWNRAYGGSNNDFAPSVVQTGDGGYALVGYIEFFSLSSCDAWLVKTDAFGNFQWGKTYGGTNDESASSMVQTFDGGYALAGYTNSFGSGGTNFYLVKTDVIGNLQWNKTYGGAGTDIAYSIVQAGDGGYALAGYTNSFGAGVDDFWLVKTDPSGTMQWNKTYGGTSYDVASSLVQTFDGGYALAGHTDSFGAGFADFWLVKVKPEMNLEHRRNLGGTNINVGWSKTYGGTYDDKAYSVVQTSDGGYAIAGYTGSFGAGLYDFWLVKTDGAGNLQWNRIYGGAGGFEEAYSVVQTRDGGYALAGYTNSYGAGDSDFWLVKTDSAGVAQWNKTYGGIDGDVASSMVQTGDGGFALVGYTWSYGAGGTDLWLVKTDATGNVQWSRTYGGASDDAAYSVVQTSDEGYAIAGHTFSFGAVSGDSWLVKTDLAGRLQWSQAYGGAGSDSAYSVVQTDDGGYALAGDSGLVKSDIESGLIQTGLTSNSITLYRGSTDLYWNYVRVRIWLIKEPSWIYGDLNMDGIVDAKDLYILSRNYGKTFSLLSLTGIIAVAGIHTVKKRKQTKTD